MGLTRQEKARRETKIAAEISGSSSPVELPEVRKLSELFSEMRPIKDLLFPDRKLGEYFCSTRGVGAYWNVTPTSVVAKILDGMMKDVGMSFQIVIRESGTALVTARYDQIIGGRWLAIIDAAKIRTVLR